MEDDVEADSKIAVDGSIIEYKARDHEFSQTKGVARDDTLAKNPRFSQTKGVAHDDTLAKDHGFSQAEGVDHDVTLSSRFFHNEGVDLVQVGPVAKGFKVHEKDSHVHRMMMILHGLLPIPRALYSKIEEMTCMELYLCDFNRCNTLVLILYGEVIFSTVCPRQLMMWCLLILAHDADYEDDGVWHVPFVP